MNLFTQTFFLWKISLNMLKDIAKAILGFAPIPHYKHPQRKLWLTILLGKTRRQSAAWHYLLLLFFQKPVRRNSKIYVNLLDFCYLLVFQPTGFYSLSDLLVKAHYSSFSSLSFSS